MSEQQLLKALLDMPLVFRRMRNNSQSLDIKILTSAIFALGDVVSKKEADMDKAFEKRFSNYAEFMTKYDEHHRRHYEEHKKKLN